MKIQLIVFFVSVITLVACTGSKGASTSSMAKAAGATRTLYIESTTLAKFQAALSTNQNCPNMDVENNLPSALPFNVSFKPELNVWGYQVLELEGHKIHFSSGWLVSPTSFDLATPSNLSTFDDNGHVSDGETISIADSGKILTVSTSQSGTLLTKQFVRYDDVIGLKAALTTCMTWELNHMGPVKRAARNVTPVSIYVRYSAETDAREATITFDVQVDPKVIPNMGFAELSALLVDPANSSNVVAETNNFYSKEYDIPVSDSQIFEFTLNGEQAEDVIPRLRDIKLLLRTDGPSDDDMAIDIGGLCRNQPSSFYNLMGSWGCP